MASARTAVATATDPAQSGPATGAAIQIKQALLNRNGFNVNWYCGNTIGRSFVTFLEESGKIIVDINNYAAGECKSEAKVTDTGAILDGCREAKIAMSFDANNKGVPFKGKGPRCSYEFVAK